MALISLSAKEAMEFIIENYNETPYRIAANLSCNSQKVQPIQIHHFLAGKSMKLSLALKVLLLYDIIITDIHKAARPTKELA